MTGRDEDIDALSEDKLLALPEANVALANLPKLRSLHAIAIQKRNADELARELTGASTSHRMLGYDPEKRKQEERDQENRHRRHLQELRDYEQAMQEVREREDHLLARIDAEERRLEKQRKEIEDNAIRLTDGRRVYVDGQTYRDEQGREVLGVDRDEAAEQHREKPQASTWDQWSNTHEQLEEEARIKREIEARRAQRETGDKLGEDERQERVKEEQTAIGRYEQQQDNIEKRAVEIEKQGINQYSAAYGSTSYAAAMDGKDASGAAVKTEFASAAEGPGRGEILFPGQPAVAGVRVLELPKPKTV
jgi:hypothetical protein